ncbi:MAG: hypothetical protein ACOC0D_02055 [Spirochaeta sp.]
MICISVPAAASDTLEVSTAIQDDILIIEVQGISRDSLFTTLKKGMRTRLSFELEIYLHSVFQQRVLFDYKRTHILRYDPFENRMIMYAEPGDRAEFGLDSWFDAFRRTTMSIGQDVLQEIPEGSEIRIRAVWDPVLLIPGFRFLRMIVPGLRRTGPWTVITDAWQGSSL